jgi:endonuclease/exonuclease/phosphatase family metal-dependent hydrolase
MRRRLLILPAILLLGLTWHASLPAPTGPADGTTLDGAASPADATCGFAPDRASLAKSRPRPKLRVATYNVHGCKGADGRRDIDRVAENLRGLDLVALNEVHGPWAWESLDQAGLLGRRLGMAWLFAPAERTWYHRPTGNGLLCALPVSSWQRIPLSRQSGRGYRNAVLVDLDHAGHTVRVLLTHVARSDDQERQRQLRTVIDLFLSLDGPAVLLGDLNSDADDPQIRALLATTGVSDPVGEILGDKTPRRIDWIITRGLRAVDAGLRDNGASDHPLLWAELR